jgi:gamma-glutamylcyclotransferase (GGCT)/AIG2-like uncharacterized protein YtfP
MNRLFVYGSLAPGESHYFILSPLVGRWQKASVRGRLYPDGNSGTRSWPGLKLDPQAEVVPGYLFTSRQLARHWQQLDDFEGSFYRRVRARVKLEDGNSVIAYLYEQIHAIRQP